MSEQDRYRPVPMTIGGIALRGTRLVPLSDETKVNVHVEIEPFRMPQRADAVIALFSEFPADAQVSVDDDEGYGTVDVYWVDAATADDLAKHREWCEIERAEIADREAFEAWKAAGSPEASR